MNQNAIVAGSFADIRTVKSRSVVVLHIEVPIERAAEVIDKFGFPQPGNEIPVAVARLVAEPSPVPAQPEQSSKPVGRKWDDMTYAQQAGIACGEPEFWTFLEAKTHNIIVDPEDGPLGPIGEQRAGNRAAYEVRDICKVKSRREFDTDEAAAERWRTLYGEYKRWRAGQREAERQVAHYLGGR